MMADILNPWLELESDIVLPPSFSPHFPLPLQEVKVETEDSEASASSYREYRDFSHGQATYISLDSYEQISSPQSSYSHESLSPITTNSDNSVTSPLCIKSAPAIPETSSPLRFQYSPIVQPEQSRSPSEYLNRATPPLGALDSPSVRQLCQSMEDYRNSVTTFPGLLELNGFQHDFLPHDLSHPFYTHWPTTANTLEENPDSGKAHEQLRNYHGDQQLLEVRTSKECVNCGSSSAILWWQDGTGHFLCNVCSQTLKTNTDNTLVYKDIRKPQKRIATTKRTAMVCANCKADKTSLWRRNNLGETVCNACGLYYKLHKCNRPITMKKDSIQKRKRKPKSSESKPKGRNSRSLKDTKIVESDSSRLQASPDVVLKQEPIDTNFAPSSAERVSSHQSDYANSIRLLPPVYSLDGFKSSLSPSESYISSNYTRISPLTSLTSVGNLPSVDIFQGHADYSASAISQSSILSPMSC